MKIIAITGGSGSGKSFLVNCLMQDLKEQASVLSLDNYYKPRETQLKDHKGIENFDIPEAFKSEQLLEDLNTLKSGKSVRFKQYNYNNPELKVDDIVLDPKEILILEGIFVMTYPEVLSIIDFSVFVEADKELSLQRRLKRDFEERGYGEDDVLYRYHQHVYPAYVQYILPNKEKANLVLKSDETLVEKAKELVLMLKKL